jgi:branched-chain amino acid transport system ATP-binding protein
VSAVQALRPEAAGYAIELKDLRKSFGKTEIIRGASLAVRPGERVAIIGPNGAGKSTLFGLIGGQLRADAGTVGYDGAPIDRLPPHHRAKAGIAVVFQGARVFAGMTVLENVMVGAHASTRAGFVSAVTRLGRHRAEERAIARSARECLARTGLLDWADRQAEALPLGQQRVVQVARALCGRPRLLLLDEPASGLRAAERERLASLLSELKAEGLTMLLVEHDVAFVTRLADRITVLDLGQVIAEGTPAEIRADEKVVAAYLGTEVPA